MTRPRCDTPHVCKVMCNGYLEDSGEHRVGGCRLGPLDGHSLMWSTLRRDSATWERTFVFRLFAKPQDVLCICGIQLPQGTQGEGVASILSNCILWFEKRSVLLAFKVKRYSHHCSYVSMAWNFFNYFKLFFFAPTQSAEERKRKSQH